MAGVIGIIQARIGSSRLPAKILAPIAGEPLLSVLSARLDSARVDEWWLATTAEREDDITAAWGRALGMGVHRGAVEDVLSRFTSIIRERRPSWILRVTADDPFMDGEIVNALIDALPEAEKRTHEGGGKRVSLIEIGGPEPIFPLGYAPQLARADDVLASEGEIPADQPFHRSHVLSWLRAHTQPFAKPAPESWPRRPEWRWTVDTPLDLEMTRDAFDQFGTGWREITYVDMVAALDGRPDITRRNRDVRQKELHEG